MFRSVVVELKSVGFVADIFADLERQERVSSVRKCVERIWYRVSVRRLSRINALRSSGASRPLFSSSSESESASEADSAPLCSADSTCAGI